MTVSSHLCQKSNVVNERGGSSPPNGFCGGSASLASEGAERVGSRRLEGGAAAVDDDARGVLLRCHSVASSRSSAGRTRL